MRKQRWLTRAAPRVRAAPSWQRRWSRLARQHNLLLTRSASGLRVRGLRVCAVQPSATNSSRKLALSCGGSHGAKRPTCWRWPIDIFLFRSFCNPHSPAEPGFCCCDGLPLPLAHSPWRSAPAGGCRCGCTVSGELRALLLTSCAPCAPSCGRTHRRRNGAKSCSAPRGRCRSNRGAS